MNWASHPIAAILPARLQQGPGLQGATTPNDHFNCGPDAAVSRSRQESVYDAGCDPGVGRQTASPAGVEIHVRTAKNPAPHNHIAASPHRCVRPASLGAFTIGVTVQVSSAQSPGGISGSV